MTISHTSYKKKEGDKQEREINLFKRKLKIMRDLEMKIFNLKQTSCKANYNLEHNVQYEL